MTVYIKGNKDFLDFPKTTNIPSGGSGEYYTKTEIDEKFSKEDEKILNAKQEAIDLIPTKVSDLQNDSGFITPSALIGYATENYVNNAISQSLGEIETILGGI